MRGIFISFVNISISAGWAVLAVLALRHIIGRAPKRFICALWLIVAIRLCMPFPVKSIFSLIPADRTIHYGEGHSVTYINSGIEGIDKSINGLIHSGDSDRNVSSEGFDSLIGVFSLVWIAGVIILFIYWTVSYIMLSLKLRDATLYFDNVYRSEKVCSSFVFGLVKPSIFIPYYLDGEDCDHIIAHERSHIARKDHLVKAFSFALLSLYWFNPLIWVAYRTLCRDIERACDERVICSFSKEERKAYSKTLLRWSMERESMCFCPLAFGETGIKERIRSVMSYKAVTRGVSFMEGVASALAAVCLLTNPSVRAEGVELFTEKANEAVLEKEALRDDPKEKGKSPGVVIGDDETPFEVRFTNTEVYINSFYYDDDFPVKRGLVVVFDLPKEIYETASRSAWTSWGARADFVNGPFDFWDNGNFNETKFCYCPLEPSWDGGPERYEVDFFLPDDPSLEGHHTVGVEVGGASFEIDVDLEYEGSFSEGGGWSLQ